jgi:hypothetical protein
VRKLNWETGKVYHVEAPLLLAEPAHTSTGAVIEAVYIQVIKVNSP